MLVLADYLENHNAVHVTLRDELRNEEYGEWIPWLDMLVERRAELNFLVEVGEFRGWERGGPWERLDPSLRPFSQIRRLALVADDRWQSLRATVSGWLPGSEVRTFPPAAVGEARHWIGLASESNGAA